MTLLIGSLFMLFVLCSVIYVVYLLIKFLVTGGKSKNEYSQNPQSRQNNNAGVGANFKGQTADYVPLSESGIYILEGDKIVPLHILPGNGSINNIIQMLGYSSDDIGLIVSRDLKIFKTLSVDKKSLRPVILDVEDRSRPISYADLRREYNAINWDFQRSLF